MTIVLLSGLMAGPLFAQQAGSITGTVKDQTGAVLPGVSVTITNTGTNAQRDFVSDERGDYNVTLLPVGVYRIEAELTGFKTGVADNIKLNVNDKLRIDFSLEVGQISERLVVTEAAPLVQSETSSVGGVIDNQKVVELPLNGRQFESLSQLVPGSLSPAPNSSLGFRGGFNSAGARETSNTIILDGVDNNDPAINNFTLRPIVDAIQEFKVLANSYSAEFGRGGGAQVTVSTKSGTNEFHGAAWEFLRNDKLDARDFFNTTGQKSPLRRNQFGATFGGPVLLPGYDGHDKTFFFAAYEGIRLKRQVTSLQRVPSEANRNGDFAGAAALRDPVNGGTFANNRIPANRISSVAQRILSRGSFPLPTAGLTGANNYRATNPFPNTVDQFNARIDHRVSQSNTLFGRFGFTRDNLDTPCSGNGSADCVPGFPHNDSTHAQSLSLVDTHVFSPRLVNEVRVGFNRQVQPRIQLTSGSKDISSDLGIVASRNAKDFGHPTFIITGYSQIGDRGYQNRAGNTYQATDTLNYTLGSHSIRFGFEFRRIEFNAISNSRESFRFDGRFTGNPFADFLLGFPNQTNRDLSDTARYHRVHSYNGFIQDDFKFSDKLTVNLGLRYEYNTPGIEKQNRFAHLNVNTFKYEIATRDGASRALYNSDLNNFGPRIGFAYRPAATADFVVRGGWGMFYDLAIVGNNLFFIRTGPPFQAPQQFNASTNPTELSLSDPFPAGRLQASSIFNAPSVDPDFRDAYIQQWNLGIQREIFSNTVAEVSYVGNRGTRLVRQVDINQAFPGTGAVQARRPLPNYGVVNVLQSSGNSIYHGLLGRLERRFSGGLSFLASYTYGHAIDDNSSGGQSAQNPRNLSAERASSDFDARQRIVVSYIYELPFGKDKRWGAALPMMAQAILGGWEFSGITTYQSGRPVSAGLASQRSNTGSTRDRPNATGVDPVFSNRTSRTAYANPAAFVLQPANAFGNAGRNSFDGPGTANWDFTLSKNFRGEGHNVQFRAEFFNAFNRPFLHQPISQFDNPAYGTINRTLRDNRQIQFGLKVTY